MTPHQLIAKSMKADLSDRIAYQEQFVQLRELLGPQKQEDADPRGRGERVKRHWFFELYSA
jgi:hypothetical protein